MYYTSIYNIYDIPYNKYGQYIKMTYTLYNILHNFNASISLLIFVELRYISIYYIFTIF